MVCLVDRGHPRLGPAASTLADLAELPHAVAAFGPGILTPVDRVFGELGIDRRIEVSVAGWLPLPFVIEGTDLVAVVPERLARIHPVPRAAGPGGAAVRAGAARRGLLVRPGPAADPAHQWLFARLDELAAELATDTPRGR